MSLTSDSPTIAYPQGDVETVKHLLFICGKNRRRSPTAEQVFSTWPDVAVASAGLSNDAVTQLDGELLEWADVVFVMERRHEAKLRQRFRRYLKDQRVICLGVADDFDYMEPALIDLLIARVGPHLVSR